MFFLQSGTFFQSLSTINHNSCLYGMSANYFVSMFAYKIKCQSALSQTPHQMFQIRPTKFHHIHHGMEWHIGMIHSWCTVLVRCGMDEGLCLFSNSVPAVVGFFLIIIVFYFIFLQFSILFWHQTVSTSLPCYRPAVGFIPRTFPQVKWLPACAFMVDGFRLSEAVITIRGRHRSERGYKAV